MLFTDKAEFKTVFNKHYVPLCNYANSILRNDTLAEDLVQDVFFHLWKNNSTLDLVENMSSFLFTSVKNKAFEHIRADKAYKKALSGYKEGGIQDKIDPDMSSLTQKYMGLERLSSLMRHLPPKCRNVFALHKLNGLTYAEIAASEGISIKTVENHMIKALKILRTEYAKS